MNYTSTITSKGTITLPAAIRAKLGLREGDKVEIALHDNTVAVKAQVGWDEFFSDELDMGKKARQLIASGAAKPLLTNAAIDTVVRSERTKRHAKS